MNEISTPAQTDIDLALERSGNIITTHYANLALYRVRKEVHPDDIAIALIRLAHLH